MWYGEWKGICAIPVEWPIQDLSRYDEYRWPVLMDLATEPPGFYRLMDDMLDFNLRWIDRWTRLEYDGLHFADDWGGRNAC